MRLGILSLLLVSAAAADWPEWRGAGRQGVWSEDRIVTTLPASGLKTSWRVPIDAGYSGPSVAANRVFVLDHKRMPASSRVTERALCLDELTGKTLWTRSWDSDYRGLEYPNGPRATPTVDGDRVYVLGAKGSLRCLRAATGDEIWSSDFTRDFGTEVPAWGMSAAPLIVGDKLIAIAGGKGTSKVVAFDKLTGKVLWRALSSDESEPGYSQPVLIRTGANQQVIVWHATALQSLHPDSGATLWTLPFRIRMNTPIATPAWSAPHLFVSGFFDGARMMELDGNTGARLIWSSGAAPEVNELRSDKLHTLMSQVIIEGDYLYGVCSFGQLRCLRRSTGERVWESQALTVEKARSVTAWLVRNGDRVFALNDRGELVIAKLAPTGYTEISRAKVIEPTSPPGSRRELGAVVWSHPAFANRHIVLRNDREIIRLSLDRKDYP